MKKCLVVIGVLFYSCAAWSAQTRVWNLFAGEEGASIRVAVDYEEYSGLSIDLASASQNQPEAASSQAFMPVLVEYLTLASANKPDEITPLYYVGDGSRARFETEISEIPNKFSKFNLVKRAELLSSVVWGDYVAVNMNFYGDNGLLSGWTELFSCAASECKLSNRLFHQDARSSFLSVILTLLNTESKPGDTAGMQAIYSGEKAVQPIYIKTKLNRFSKDIQMRRVYQKFDWPALVSGIKLKSDNAQQVLWVLEFIYSIWQLDAETPYTQALSMQPAYQDKVRKYWGEDAVNGSLVNYHFKAADANQSNQVSPLESATFASYAMGAFLQTITSWTAVSPIAYIGNNELVFMWFIAEDAQGGKAKYIFCVDKSKNSLVSPDSSRIGILMTNQVYATTINEFLLGQ